MKAPPYTVVPHLDLFRITGFVSSAAGLVTFKEKKVADDVCRLLHAAHQQGADGRVQEFRDLLGIMGGRR